MLEVVFACPECGVRAGVLPREDRVTEDAQDKCSQRINPLNCPTLRRLLWVGRQELNERRFQEFASGAFRPFSNVRHSVVVEGKPDIETEPKWSE
jgi:hypothetical protein